MIAVNVATAIIRPACGFITIFLLAANCLVVSMASARDLEWNRDPFLYQDKSRSVASPPPGENNKDQPEAVLQKIVLQGIYVNAAGFYVAIVDGEQYLRGDTIGKAQVVEIKPYEIIVSEAGLLRKVGLFGQQVKWGNYEN